MKHIRTEYRRTVNDMAYRRKEKPKCPQRKRTMSKSRTLERKMNFRVCHLLLYWWPDSS